VVALVSRSGGDPVSTLALAIVATVVVAIFLARLFGMI
jgi:hypothetical protein